MGLDSVDWPRWCGRWAAPALALLLSGCGTVGTGSEPAPPDGLREAARHERIEPRPGVVLHAVTLELRGRGRLRLSAFDDRGRVPAEMTGAAAARIVVNASFFDRAYVPRGHTVSEGEVWPGVLVPLASPLLACDRTQRCRIDFEPGPQAPADGHTVVAGTPWLVRGGVARTADDDQRCPALCARTHPRTAIGLDAHGRRLFIVLAEGRREGVPGVTLAELAAWMQGRGVHDAINLDGGGSSLLLVSGRSVMARPANEPAPRPVANVLLWMPVPAP